MSTAPALAGARPSQRPWNTLQRLRWLRGGLLLLDGAVLLAVLVAAQHSRQDLRLLGTRGAPGVASAQQIEAALSAMDAVAAGDLLRFAGETQAATEPVYQARRRDVAHGLVGAAEQIGQNENVRQPLEALETGLGDYDRRLQRAFDLAEHDPGASAAAYRQAAATLDTRLLPAAAALDAISSRDLETAAITLRVQSSVAAAVLATGIVLLLLLLVSVQIFLSRRTRRTLNLPLLAATLLTGGAAVHLAILLAQQKITLQGAHGKALTAVHQVMETRSAALASVDEMSRALVDPQHSGDWQAASRQSAARVASLPPGLSLPQLLEALRDGRQVDGFSGLLATAAGNDQAPGTRRLALAALEAWQGYRSATQQALQQAAAGHRREVVEELTGPARGGLSPLGAHFDEALTALLAAEQAAFDRDLRQSTTALRREALEALVVSTLLAGLILLGFAPRLREYR